MVVKRKTSKKKAKPKLSPEQKRNSDIFRLRGFYSNAKTLPFNDKELVKILCCVDEALQRMGALSQTIHIAQK